MLKKETMIALSQRLQWHNEDELAPLFTEKSEAPPVPVEEFCVPAPTAVPWPLISDVPECF